MIDTEYMCRNCGKYVDALKLPKECFAVGITPNTLTGLKDKADVRWKCPHCNYWHLTPDDPIFDQ